MIREDRYVSHEKLYARQELLIDTFRLSFNKMSIDEDKHIVTLCGSNNIDGKTLHPFSEYAHFLSNEFISSPEQYIGVDNDTQIIQANRKVLPSANYICDDIENVIEELNINPEVIFFDTNRMGKTKKFVVDPLSHILSLVAQRFDHRVMVVFNWMGRGYKQSVSPEDALLSFMNNNHFQKAMNVASWEIGTEYYSYKNGSVGMYAFWFLKLNTNERRSDLPLIRHTETQNGGMTFGGSILPFKKKVQNAISFINHSSNINTRSIMDLPLIATDIVLAAINQAIEDNKNTHQKLLALQRMFSRTNGKTKSVKKTAKPSRSNHSKTVKTKKEKDPKMVKAGKKAAETRRLKKLGLYIEKPKDPKWVEAGKKAAETRRRNGNK